MLEEPEVSAEVFDETAPLQGLMVWGEPGCEALLVQLLPKSKSLFRSYYEVPEAREEFKRMQALIEREGVKVIRAKDAFAESLPGKPMPDLPADLAELERRLIRRADEYFESYRTEKIQEIAHASPQPGIEDIFVQVKQDFRKVLREDAQHYGEPAAIRLNYVLSLSRELPIANIFYGRDQANALGNQILLSSMRWDIRKREIGIYKAALLEMGYGKYLVEIDRGTAEGGDIMLFGDTCYIGVGSRTTTVAARDIYEKIGTHLEAHGLRMVAVVNERHEMESAALTSPSEEQMPVMHLDMFWIPLENGLVLAYAGEVDQRYALLFTRKQGEVVTQNLGSFENYLKGRNITVLEVTSQEQKDFAINLLNLGNKRVIVPLSKNRRVIAELKNHALTAFDAELNKPLG